MYTKEELETFTYRQLQKLCKQLNLKANKKSSDLLNDLFQIFGQLEKEEQILQENLGLLEQPTKLVDAKDNYKNDESVVKENQCQIASLSDHNDQIIIIKSSDHNDKNEKENKELIESNIEMNKENLKKEIAKEVDKRAEIKVSKIPRAKDLEKSEVSMISDVKDDELKSPGRFLTQHKAQFKKMDSLDVYMEKKRQRADMIKSTTLQKNVNTKLGIAMSSKSIYPLSNCTFDNKVTPGKILLRSSPRLSQVHTDGKKVMLKGRKSVHFTGVATLTKSGTRLNTTLGNSGSPGLKKTPIKFDLQASLEKGLSYKPHSGKLKQVYFQGNALSLKSLNTSSTEQNKISVKEITKQPKSRNERRMEMSKTRESKRNSIVSKRRKVDI